MSSAMWALIWRNHGHCLAAYSVAHGLRQAVIAARFEALDGALPVTPLVVLVELALAVQASQVDLDADDVPEQLGQVVGRCVAHLPRHGLVGFMLARQAGHDAADELLVVAHMDRLL